MNASTAPLELRDYLALLWRRKWIIAAMTVVAVGAALFYSFRQTPEYVSSSEIIVYPVRFDPEGRAAVGFLSMETEQRVANSTPVAERATEELEDSGMQPGQVSVERVTDSSTLLFTATAPDPAVAQASAQAWAEAYLELRRETALVDLEGVRAPYDQRIEAINGELRRLRGVLEETESQSQIQILQARYTSLLTERAELVRQRNLVVSEEGLHVGEMLRPAELPASPSNRNHVTTGALALLVGMSLGIGVAYLRDRLDQRVRGLEEMEVHSGGPVLAFLPSGHPMKNNLPITVAEPRSDLAEAYTALSFRLLRVAADRDVKTLVVTSSLQQEGKSSIVANLGVAMAQSRKRVILVSADLRRPGLRMSFPGWDGPGLVDAVRDGRPPSEAMSGTSVPNLWIVHDGASLEGASPLEVLSSEAMRTVLAELRASADFVLIDTPSLLGTYDAATLAAFADGVLFVADGKKANSTMVDQARRELELTGTPVLGVAVNRYDPRAFGVYGYRYEDNLPGLGAGNGQQRPAGRHLDPGSTQPAGD